MHDELITWIGVRDFENKIILDIGCGTGIQANYLIETFPGIKRIFGVDESLKMIQVTREESVNPKVSFIKSDMNSLPFEDNTFDIIYSRYTMHYSKNLSKTLEEVWRVARKGAVFSFLDSHPFFNVFFKKSKDYFKKEVVIIPIQKGKNKVLHSSFTIGEYISSINDTGWKILGLEERGGNLLKKLALTDLELPSKIVFRLRK